MVQRMTTNTTKIGKFSKALQKLVQLIESGQEYGTAHEHVCLEFKLSPKQGKDLTAEYDKL